MRSKTEDHPALTHLCPFCGADPGTPCITKFGRELEFPHARRLDVVEPKPPTPVKQALCCQCGQLRTYRDAWRARGFYKPEDEWRRRWVGELKCSHCAAITPHALLMDPAAEYRDVDEREQLLALGDQPRTTLESLRDLTRLRREYREAVPRNPNLRHRWWVRDEQVAREAGCRQVPTLCGGVHQLQGDTQLAGAQRVEPDYVAPKPVRVDEYDDLGTGMSWRDGDCVDCLRVFNARVLEYHRQQLQDWLWRTYSDARRLDAATTERLITALKQALPPS